MRGWIAVMFAHSDVSVGGPPYFCPCCLAGANPSISTASRPRHQPSAVWQGRHLQASKRCAQRSAAKYTTKTLQDKKHITPTRQRYRQKIRDRIATT
jgi:hypothetical protein